uniref:Uncharacterized protein n=1 Tax=Amphimedon queenslandica TaxID=400682 RepID=A0A1X7U4Y0_AMPQE
TPITATPQTVKRKEHLNAPTIHKHMLP